MLYTLGSKTTVEEDEEGAGKKSEGEEEEEGEEEDASGANDADAEGEDGFDGRLIAPANDANETASNALRIIPPMSVLTECRLVVCVIRFCFIFVRVVLTLIRRIAICLSLAVIVELNKQHPMTLMS